MNLYDNLLKLGFNNKLYPKKKIDRLSEKYKIIYLFHKPEYIENYDVLTKYNISVFFSDWYYIDIYLYNDLNMTFHHRDSTEDILNYIHMLLNQELLKLRKNKLNIILK